MLQRDCNPSHFLSALHRCSSFLDCPVVNDRLHTLCSVLDIAAAHYEIWEYC